MDLQTTWDIQRQCLDTTDDLSYDIEFDIEAHIFDKIVSPFLHIQDGAVGRLPLLEPTDEAIGYTRRLLPDVDSN